ncbi:hypothetical protein PIB30_114963, partial [Stylosanthes scabra]|nr:hypothetical protein [Stylosanthes scabra]
SSIQAILFALNPLKDLHEITHGRTGLFLSLRRCFFLIFLTFLICSSSHLAKKTDVNATL